MNWGNFVDSLKVGDLLLLIKKHPYQVLKIEGYSIDVLSLARKEVSCGYSMSEGYDVTIYWTNLGKMGMTESML